MNWLFKELTEISLGNRTQLSRKPSEIDWQEAYQTSAKQAMEGILLSAVDSLTENDSKLRPPLPLLYQWLGEVIQIENQNKLLNKAAAELYILFKNRGVRSCVLKGQGIATLYDIPLRRQSGDIDLWVEGGRKKVLQLLRDNSLGYGSVVIHHVDARIIEGVETEIHFIPVYACNPFCHYKLQRFFKKNSAEQFAHYDEDLRFSYPTISFNAVYILSHIYMHFLYEGIGLRQIVDYYYVLKNLDEFERKQASADIKTVGLLKFAGAVMYVLKDICGMNDLFFITQPDKRRGEQLLEEINRSGNFGKYDESLKCRNEENLVVFNLVALKRQVRFIRYYPMDIISIPFFKIGHWAWRKINGYI